jgi:hypothetical protein
MEKACLFKHESNQANVGFVVVKIQLNTLR